MNRPGGDGIVKILHVLTLVMLATALLVMLGTVLVVSGNFRSRHTPQQIASFPGTAATPYWSPPSFASLGNSREDTRVRYGRDLIAHTALFLGPAGSVKRVTNGMNCQNCHLEAGAKIFGNNYSAVASTYPRFRERSGSLEDVFKRVNECMQRSLNGTPLDTASEEMQSIRSYIVWLGQGTTPGKKPAGAGLRDVPYLDRPADPAKGKKVYAAYCERCHGKDGKGAMSSDRRSYRYPPLWGNHSYTIGAGLFRISRFAAFVKSNMPFGARFDSTVLADEDAWDVAAFVNSQPRPSANLANDWPRLAAKPVDYPFGPHPDHFPDRQHKYGPFGPIEISRQLAKR
jgi:thiosulfate dehydrogenase